MKYEVGDRVRIKSIDWYEKNKSNRGYVTIVCEAEVAFTIEMSSLCGQIVTISQKVYTQDVEFYRIREDRGTYMWTDEMIEGLVEEEVGLVDNLSSRWVNEFNLPDGYIFKDENGNVINATKIVLEKKKKEYPKTYEECCKVLQYGESLKIYPPSNADVPEYDALELFDLLETLRKLLICRDAYWRIAGEEMGLGKPWEPSGNEDCFVISRSCGEVFLFESAGDSEPFEFPTREMRDAFYENFKELIEQCKELL